jgi:apolipoprotein N-acyltransferase
VAPDGSVVRRTSLFTPAVVVVDVAQRTSATPATRLGAAPEWLLALLGAGALVAAARRGPRR